MVDVLSPEQRSYCMSQIKGAGTTPELALRRALWHLGFRYRIKSKLPGKPDIVYPTLKVAIFVDGCFWHKCPKHYSPPKTRAKFWSDKISKNVARDKKNNVLLKKRGWTVVRFWEHEIRDSLEDCVVTVVRALKSRQVKS
ncbi:very short patch repair endonuclease [Microbulbifer aggregans]|uniref:very short patch repair endonuclease n=1 Tax=Microbulbifer aggregans TaxID=1769779 RepID=UPI0009F60E3C|nr:very short patch repair endonuclease [Microbulbifer aggregans]